MPNHLKIKAKLISNKSNINSNSIRLLSIPIPTVPEAQQEIVNLATAVRKKVAALSTKLAALEQLKQSLMHDLLTGKVRVRDACLTT